MTSAIFLFEIVCKQNYKQKVHKRERKLIKIDHPRCMLNNNNNNNNNNNKWEL